MFLFFSKRLHGTWIKGIIGDIPCHSDTHLIPKNIKQYSGIVAALGRRYQIPQTMPDHQLWKVGPQRKRVAVENKTFSWVEGIDIEMTWHFTKWKSDDKSSFAMQYISVLPVHPLLVRKLSVRYWLPLPPKTNKKCCPVKKPNQNFCAIRDAKMTWRAWTHPSAS